MKFFRLFEPVVPLAEHQKLLQKHDALTNRFEQQQRYVLQLEHQLRRRRKQQGDTSGVASDQSKRPADSNESADHPVE